MRKSFPGNIKAIKKAMENRKLVIFAGAGISVDAGVPLWSELIEAKIPQAGVESLTEIMARINGV